MRKPTRFLLFLLAVTVTAGAGCGSAGPPGRPPGARFWPYLDVSLPPAGHLARLAQQTGVRHFTLAFLTAAGGACQAQWGGGAGMAAVARDVAALRAVGGDVRISFGGRDGHELASVCRTVGALRRAYQSIISALHPAGLDFDLEGAALGDRAGNRRRWAALDALGPGVAPAVALTLPVIPAGLTRAGLDAVRAAIAAGVHVSLVNLLTMDYGDGAAPAPARRMALYARQALIAARTQLGRLLVPSRSGWPWTHLGATPMIGVNDVGDEVFTALDARALVGFARAKRIGLLSMWSVGRDRPCPPNTRGGAQATCSGLAAPEGTFAAVFGR